MRVLVTAASAAALVLSACAGGAAASGARTITIQMSEFAYSPATITLAPGERVTLKLTNTGTVEHEFMAGTEPMTGMGYRQDWLAKAKAEHGGGHGMGHGGEGVRVAPKSAASVSLVVPAETGEFEFGCFVPGHLEGGMKGRLIVR